MDLNISRIQNGDTSDRRKKVSCCLTIEAFPSLVDEILLCIFNTAKIDLTTFIKDSNFVEY